ncbi:MAG: PulJ/GspJ family protein [Akkermansiaceae bacterium]
MKLPYQSRKSQKGFTLAELLVAMSVTLILVMLTLTITGTAMDSWRAARTEIRAAGQAKTMLNAIGRDLESMVSRLGNNRNQWLLATTNPGNLGPASSPSPNASRLVFFTSAADRYDGNAGSRERQGGGNGGNRNADLGGDVSVVSYELDFVEPIFGSSNQLFSTFVLYRNLLEPNEAYPNAGLWSDNIAQGFDNASRPNDLADMVCENVYDFTATFVVNYRGVDGQLQTARLPVMSSAGGDRVLRSFAITGAGLEPNQRAGSEFAGGRIASVELSITVLSDEGISILKRTPFRSPAERAQFLEKHSYRYTRSVIIPQN